MNVTLNIDTREFDRALKPYLEATHKAGAEVLNKKALFICRGALRGTKRADKSQIKGDLGSMGKVVIVQRIRVLKKSGQIRRGATIKAEALEESGIALGRSVAEMIVRWRVRRGRPLPRRVLKLLGGYTQPTTEEGLEAARMLISASLAGVGGIASGWLPAIRKLSQAVGGSGQAAGAKQFGRDHGRAVPAVPGISCKAVIENSFDNPLDATGRALIVQGEPALQRAFDEEARSMREETFRRLAAEAKRLGIRVVEG